MLSASAFYCFLEDSLAESFCMNVHKRIVIVCGWFRFGVNSLGKFPRIEL